jgi:hypothetical protein
VARCDYSNRDSGAAVLVYPDPVPTILVAVSDLMFQPRIADAARGLDLEVRLAHDAASVSEGLAAHPQAVVVDVHDAAFPPEAVIRRAHTAGARVLAFGRHTEPETLRSARIAGADKVVPRSQLVEDLPGLLQSLVWSPADAFQHEPTADAP